MRFIITDKIIKYYIEASFSSEYIEGKESKLVVVNSIYSIDDLDEESISIIYSEITWFMDKSIDIIVEAIEYNNEELNDSHYRQIMHDLWNARNGHYSGFLGGDYSDEVGESLNDTANKLGLSYFIFNEATGKLHMEVNNSILNY